MAKKCAKHYIPSKNIQFHSLSLSFSAISISFIVFRLTSSSFIFGVAARAACASRLERASLDRAPSLTPLAFWIDFGILDCAFRPFSAKRQDSARQKQKQKSLISTTTAIKKRKRTLKKMSIFYVSFILEWVEKSSVWIYSTGYFSYIYLNQTKHVLKIKWNLWMHLTRLFSDLLGKTNINILTV